MYMYYLLGYKLMELPISDERKDVMAENTYLLALDGDVDFQPQAAIRLIDMLKKNLRILHISCHGIKDGENQVQRQRCKMGLSTELVDHELE